MHVRHIIIFSGIIFALQGFSLNMIAQDIDWKLRKDKKGIMVYTRSVEGSLLDEFKGVTTIHASVDQLVSTLRDVAQYLEWIPDCASVELHDMAEEEHVHYMEMKAPFPVSNRDGYYRYRYSVQEGNVKVEIEALPEFRPEIKGLVRIPYSSGYWLFEPVSDQQTRVTYQVHADPGGSIPAWLTNAAVVDNPFQTLLNLRDLLK
jgi:ribosome-associated toxin RatA of RatAB toxin-antitoxin module